MSNNQIYLKELDLDNFNDEYVSWHKEEHAVFYSGSHRIFTKENLIDEFLRGKENKTIYHYGIFFLKIIN